MAEHPEPASEIDTTRTKREPNVGWEEPRGPLHALAWAAGCFGCGSSAIALAVIAVIAVVALVLS